MELTAGALIAGKLRLVRPLGQGGMGVVWVARHEALEADVAVKLIRPERVAADPALAARFEREAKATARIAHPHVVKVMDFGTLDGTVPYIVMELLAGFSLAELLESGGRLSLSTALALAEQVGGALESAHALGIVHRDIKPHNLFILEQAQGHALYVKVLDFGIAKLADDAELLAGAGALTETGAIVGSPPYMSPEQIEGSKHVDWRTDLWSLAVILYESLTGQRPFQGGSLVHVGSAVLEGRYRPASELRPALPRAIDDWFAKALSVDPEQRFQSARELVAALAEIARALPVESAPTPAPVVVPAAITGTAPHAPLAKKPSRRRYLAWASLAGALCLALVGGVLAVSSAGGAEGCPAGMQRVEGASFLMGSPADGETPSDESPAHELRVGAFCMDVTEVTIGDYARCDGCQPLEHSVRAEGLTPNAIGFWSQFCNRSDAEDHPVNCIDWQRANAYCEAMGKRLPTEAEWELAARGPDGKRFPWGDAPPSSERLNACGEECSRMLSERLAKTGRGSWPKMYAGDDGAPATAPVAAHAAGATPAGVYDLAGNVWEWTSSHYCRYDDPDCGDSRRVIRGGGWDTVESQDVRAARRLPSAPSARSWSVGFRCAKSL